MHISRCGLRWVALVRCKFIFFRGGSGLPPAAWAKFKSQILFSIFQNPPQIPDFPPAESNIKNQYTSLRHAMVQKPEPGKSTSIGKSTGYIGSRVSAAVDSGGSSSSDVQSASSPGGSCGFDSHQQHDMSSKYCFLILRYPLCPFIYSAERNLC